MKKLKDFIDDVRLMRQYQKEYFRTRDTKTLLNAKDKERSVDAYLKNFELEHQPKRNPELF